MGLQVRTCVIFVAEKRLQQLFIGVAAAFFVVAISVQIAPFSVRIALMVTTCNIT